MKNIALLLAIASTLAACASPPAYQPTYTPSTVEAEPVDTESGFSSEDEDRKADEAIASAQRTYEAVQSATNAFTVSSAGCDDPSMSGALSKLQVVDATAQRYMQLATSAPVPADREAAMDVLDELNTVILDGLLDVTKAYRSHKCFPHAKSIITQAKAIYAGPAYAGWVTALDTELVAINAEQVTATPRSAKPLNTRAVPHKVAAKKSKGQ